MGYILPEKGEWGIGNHNIRLFQQFDAFLGAKISVAFQIIDSYLLRIRHSIAVVVASIFEPDGTLRIILAEQVSLLIFITSRLCYSALLYYNKKIIAIAMQKKIEFYQNFQFFFIKKNDFYKPILS